MTSATHTGMAFGETHVWPEARFYAGVLCLFLVLTFSFLTLAAVAVSALPGWESVVITSDSMAPQIERGDVVLLRQHDGDDLANGKVIVFDNPVGEGLVTHRIVDTLQDGSYATKGDANGRRDSDPVAPSTIRGVGTILIPLAGLPMVWFGEGSYEQLALFVSLALLTVWGSQWALFSRYDPWARQRPTPVDRPAERPLPSGNLRGMKGQRVPEPRPFRRPTRRPQIAAALIPLILVLAQFGPLNGGLVGESRAVLSGLTTNTNSALAASPSFGCQVSLDGDSSAVATTNQLEWAHTVAPSGTDRLLVVGVSVLGQTVSSVKWQGVDLQLLNASWGPFNWTRVEIWYLLAPASGAGTVQVNTSGTASIVAGATSWTCVDQASPFGSVSFTNGFSSTPSSTVASSATSMVADTVSAAFANVTAGANQTQLWNEQSGFLRGGGSIENGAGSVTMSWDIGNNRPWAIGAVSINAVP